MENHKQKLIPGRYSVIPRTLIFVTNEDEILLLKGATDKNIWPGLYNGIGGHIEQGEDVLTAAKRELYEETGISDIDLVLRAVIFIDVKEAQGISLFVFIGKTEYKTTISSAEGSLDWIKLEHLKEFPLVEDLYKLIPLILKTDQTMMFGRYYYQGHQLIMDFN